MFGAREVPAVLTGHLAFLLADLVVFRMEGGALLRRQFAFPDFAMDAPVLVFQALIYLRAARVFLGPEAVGREGCGGRQDGQGGERKGDAEGLLSNTVLL